ncbi:hypothetical protein HDU88_005615 [Geranomyces variabilis]|nr:hypothetical protein HDU88_005615 [Geranomyces variabilis]
MGTLQKLISIYTKTCDMLMQLDKVCGNYIQYYARGDMPAELEQLTDEWDAIADTYGKRDFGLYADMRNLDASKEGNDVVCAVSCFMASLNTQDYVVDFTGEMGYDMELDIECHPIVAHNCNIRRILSMGTFDDDAKGMAAFAGRHPGKCAVFVTSLPVTEDAVAAYDGAVIYWLPYDDADECRKIADDKYLVRGRSDATLANVLALLG